MRLYGMLLSDDLGGTRGVFMYSESGVRPQHPQRLATSTDPYSCGMNAAPSFGDFIRKGRQRKGWSQDDLHAASGVSRSSISRWERGNLNDPPAPEHVRAACSALDLDPREAAVILGFLTPEELDGTNPYIPADVETILELLEHPALSADERAELLGYLKVRLDVLRHRNAG